MTDESSILANHSMKDLTIVTFPATLKLTPSNYLAWKTQIEALLHGLDLFKFINGTHPAPTPTVAADGTQTPHADYHQWFRQDRLLFGAIVGSLSPPLVPMITGATSSYEAWEILAATYASPSRGHIKQLKHRLKQSTKTPTQSISEYMQQIKTITDELAILGKQMDPEDIIDVILNGLDQTTYKPILDAIHARDTLISFNELHEKLINHELSLAQQNLNTGIHQPAAVFQMHQSPRFNNSNRNWTSRTSNIASGNQTTYPRQRSQGFSNPSTPHSPAGTRPFLGKCQWCNQRGHSLSNCFIFKKVHPHITTPSFNRNMQDKSSQVHTMTLNNTTTPTDWIFDSGATHHVTTDLNNLSLHAPYDGTEELVIGSSNETSTSSGHSHKGAV